MTDANAAFIILASVQGASTLALVAVTFVYARATNKISNAAERQVEAAIDMIREMQHQAEATTEMARELQRQADATRQMAQDVHERSFPNANF